MAHCHRQSAQLGTVTLFDRRKESIHIDVYNLTVNHNSAPYIRIKINTPMKYSPQANQAPDAEYDG